jgi:hypothetical protein
MRSAGTIEAVVVAEGAATLIVSAPVAGEFAFVSLMVSGEQVTPGGRVWHVTVTIPVNPTGVTVTVEVPVPPAIAVALKPAIVKLGCTTTTEIFFAVLNGA